jgi:hypothetical protein
LVKIREKGGKKINRRAVSDGREGFSQSLIGIP